MAKNADLLNAKNAKKDEFYTQLEDINAEMVHYENQFKGKIVLMNCDNPIWSNFWRYFHTEFDRLGLKKIIATHYEYGETASYKMEYTGGNDNYIEVGVKTPLEGNGDFRNQECLDLLDETDIVVTNPPFSCYSADTEVMTDKGWKLIKDVDISKDIIMSLNPDTKNIEMAKAVDYIKSPVNGELYHYHTRHMDFCVTGNHRMYAEYRNCNSENISIPFVKAEDVKKSYMLPLAGFSWSGKDKEYFVLPATTQLEQYSRKEITIPEKKILMEDWLEFFGFYLADGCYRDHINSCGKRDYTISIKQNKSNEEYVLNLIEKIGYKVEISRGSTDSNNNYNIYSRQLWEYLSQFGRSAEKYIPREFLDLDTKYLMTLYKGYTNGDSSLCADGHTHFSTTSVRLIENIQEIILKIFGRVVQYHKYIRKHSYDDNYGVCYSINLIIDKNRDNYSKYGVAEKVPYNDNVYCLTLEKNHIMLVRHNGKMGWCGNCFREYVATLMEYEKKFLIMGNMNALTYKEIFPLFRDNRLWYGASIHSGDRKFGVPDSYPLDAAGCGIDENGQRYIKVKGVRWFTNLDYAARHEKLVLWKKYNSEEYPKYDNYDAINVDKTSEIPMDYMEMMGVPITFLDKYNPEQFEIVGISGDLAQPLIIEGKKKSGRFYVDGRRLYDRIVIKRKACK
jgi:hypothetical protein